MYIIVSITYIAMSAYVYRGYNSIFNSYNSCGAYCYPSLMYHLYVILGYTMS